MSTPPLTPDEFRASLARWREINRTLYTQTVVCSPDIERQVIDACPDGFAVRSSPLVPDNTMYVINNDHLDRILDGWNLPFGGW